MKTSRPLRFAMVTTFYPPFSFGGDGQYVRRLAHALARRGHAVEIVHDADAYRLFRGAPDPAPLTEPPGVTVHTLRSGAPALSCLATQQLGRLSLGKAGVEGGGLADNGLYVAYDLLGSHSAEPLPPKSTMKMSPSSMQLSTSHEPSGSKRSLETNFTSYRFTAQSTGTSQRSTVVPLLGTRGYGRQKDPSVSVVA